MSSARRIGAFFDLDRTVLQGPSLEMRFGWWLLTQRHLGWQRTAAWAARVAARSIVCEDRGAFRANKTYLAGLRESVVSDWSESLAPDGLTVLAKAAERIQWHVSQGHYVCFVSGTLEPLAQMVARRFGDSTDVSATKLEVVDRIWTGFINGNHVTGPEKAREVAKIAQRNGLSLEASFAYGNHPDDIPMLELVGNPVVVNPGVRLRRFATRRHWKINRWATPLVDNTPTVSTAEPVALSSEEAR
jgi:HAD superfamily hydrolase (TIGR01490 family)